MHRVATLSGELDHERKFETISQNPSEILFISTADTELAGLAKIWSDRFGKKLGLFQSGHLLHPKAAENFVDNVLCKARLAIFRLHGGYGYFPHLLDEVSHIKSHGAKTSILVLPGTDEWDPELMRFNDYEEPLVNRMFSYFREGGIENMVLAADAVELLLQNRNEGFPEAFEVPKFGWIENRSAVKIKKHETGRVWITFYRALHQSGDMAVIDSLTESLQAQGLAVSKFYAYSLREQSAQQELLRKAEQEPPDAILTMQGFSIGSGPSGNSRDDRISFLETLNCPVIQVPTSTEDREAWLKNPLSLIHI